ncbi:MAG: transposase, partial [Thermogutta sp.]
TEPAPTDHTQPRRYPLPEIIRQFKTFSARRINETRRTPGVPVWQRNYYEHIIRNDESLNRIREYIANNPAQWEMDRENPVVVGAGSEPAPTEPAPTGNEPWRI